MCHTVTCSAENPLPETVEALAMAQKDFTGKLGDEFPNIEAPSTFGDIKLHDYWGDGWGAYSVPVFFATRGHRPRFVFARVPCARL